MPTFEQQPDWWVSLATLTQWLHWPAVSALLSFLALTATIRLADRARREARRKDIAILLGLAEALATVDDIYRGMLKRMNEQNYKIELAAAIEVAMIDHFAKVIEQVKLTDLPTPAAAGVFVTVRAWLERMPGWLKEWSAADFHEAQNDLQVQLKFLTRIIATFRAEAGRLSDEQRFLHRLTASLKSLPTGLRMTARGRPSA